MAEPSALNEPTANAAPTAALPMAADTRDLFALTKPRVMSLVVFTALCGMIAAAPAQLPLVLGFATILAIALGAGASGALNQWYEADIDKLMKRTAARPLPAGRMEHSTALAFGVGLAAFSVFLCLMASNWLAALILLVSILFYVFVYTMWLKPRTPQNIVIGGAAGAFPPMIGWAAATGNLSALPILMFLLIFFWTPPHFWALALFIKSDYANAGIPMMPVVAGTRSTRRQIVVYTVIMAVTAVAPWALGLTSMLYGGIAVVLSVLFLILALRVGNRAPVDGDAMKPEKQLFAFSILYLFVLFAALAVDRYAAAMIQA